MDLLNENSLASLLNNCYRNRRYRACILFNNREDVNTLLNELIEIHNQDGIDGVERFIQHNPAQVRFENGSVLSLFTTDDAGQIRGYRCHEALLHEDVMDTDAMLNIQSHIRDYVPEDNNLLNTLNYCVAQAARVFDREYQSIWEPPNNSDIEIKVDEKSEEVLSDFLDSFKINNSL